MSGILITVHVRYLRCIFIVFSDVLVDGGHAKLYREIAAEFRGFVEKLEKDEKVRATFNFI